MQRCMRSFRSVGVRTQRITEVIVSNRLNLNSENVKFSGRIKNAQEKDGNKSEERAEGRRVGGAGLGFLRGM